MINTDRKQQWDTNRNAWDTAFSNFERTPIAVEYDGGTIHAPTGEHAFQALKTTDPEERQRVLDMDTPTKAKRAGRKVTLRDDWDGHHAIEVMFAVVRAKAEQDSRTAEALRNSGDDPIIEVTAWNDTRWGTTKTGKGANALGQILMAVRDEIR